MTLQKDRLADANDVIQDAIDGAAAQLRVACPGIVKGVDLTAQTVTVQLALQGKTTDKDGNESYADIPLLNDVPIVWPRAGGFALTFPVKVGDECLVVFGDRCIDAWWQSSGVQKPMDARQHDLSDGFAIFGCTSQPMRLENVQSNAVELRTDSRSDWIQIDNAGQINIEHTSNMNVKTGGNLTAEIAGNADVTISGNATATVSGNLTASIGGNADITVKGSTTLDCPTTTITGNLIVQGSITGQSGMTISGGSGNSTAVFNGSIEATGDVTAGNISLQSHTHSGVETGSGNTGTPN